MYVCISAQEVGTASTTPSQPRESLPAAGRPAVQPRSLGQAIQFNYTKAGTANSLVGLFPSLKGPPAHISLGHCHP